ncbi:MAG: hypothetical protein SPK64_01835 [Candidatus Enterosoma sp.]|nr:DNA-binding protein [Bacilli bacterium]MDY5649776.1 hypothetical protein [Candidatus Enterosoma sp.]
MEDILQKKERIFSLFQIYGKLLTEKNYRRMEFFLFDDLSLFEIAEIEKVSRNAIFQSIKNSSLELVFYEKKINLLDNLIKLKEKIEKIDGNEEIKESIMKENLYGI